MQRKAQEDAMKGRLEGASEQGGSEEPPWGRVSRAPKRRGHTSQADDCQEPASPGLLPPAQGHRQGPLSHGRLVPGTSLTLKTLSPACPKAPSLTSPTGHEISTLDDLGLKTAVPGSSSLLTIASVLNCITVLGVDLS